MERGAWPAGLNRVLEGLRSRARRGESVTHEGGTKEPGVPTKALAGCPGFRQTTSSPLCGRPPLRFTLSPPPPPGNSLATRLRVATFFPIDPVSFGVSREAKTLIDALKSADAFRGFRRSSIRTADTTLDDHLFSR